MADLPPRRELSDLVRRRRADLELPLRDLAKKCILPGTDRTLDHTWINQLENGKIPRMPSPDQLEALAKGLELKSRSVKLAAAQQYLDIYPVEVPHPDDPSRIVTLIAAHLDRMSLEDQQKLIRIAEVMAGPEDA